jgi:hypothetical protein
MRIPTTRNSPTRGSASDPGDGGPIQNRRSLYDYRPGDRRFLELGRDLVNRFDAVENLRHLGQWIDTTSEDPERSLKPLEGNLPPRTLGSEGTQEMDELIRYLAVNLLVIATDAERIDAMVMLRESTGLGYDSVKEWRAWWRGRYSGISPGPPAPRWSNRRSRPPSAGRSKQDGRPGETKAGS